MAPVHRVDEWSSTAAMLRGGPGANHCIPHGRSGTDGRTETCR